MPNQIADDLAEGRPCDIVGIGVSVWDTVFLVDAYPNHGTVVRANRRIEGIGGGVTVAVATAARLGSSTAMIDSLGDDQASNRIVQTLANQGVQTRGIVQQPDRTGSVASIWSDTQSSERTIVYSPGGSSELLKWNPIIEQLVTSAKIVHLNGRHAEVCAQAIQLGKQVGAKLSFDGGAYRYREETIPMLRQADIAIVAHQFAESHYRHQGGSEDTPSLQRLAEFFMNDLACEIVGVTEGTKGSYLIQRDGDAFHQPAVEVERAIDTTGCGDTYHGAFLHAIAIGDSLRSAAKFAAEIASSNAQSMGALAFSRNSSIDQRFTSP